MLVKIQPANKLEQAKNMKEYKFFQIEKNKEDKTAVLFLNRPEARNAMNWDFWEELPLVINDLEKDADVRCVIVAARGKSFSTGLDVVEFFTRFKDVLGARDADERDVLKKLLFEMQKGMQAMADGENIYIAAVHKHCIGGALDLISACDIRLASQDASVSLRETRVAIVADMGSLNRLPAIIGMGNTRLMAYTGRDFKAEECEKMGLFSGVYENQTEVLTQAQMLAKQIASNPSLAVRGSKRILNYVADHSLKDGLDYVGIWNSAFLDSQDFREIGQAFIEKRKPNFK